jgi:hypothetical protein
MHITHFRIGCFASRNLFALAAGIILLLISGAQTAEAQAENRWLFIFDTSSAMKARVPATQYEINSLLSTAMSSQLRLDDTIGVWTFDQQLHTGGFPLTRWAPEDASMLASNMNVFVKGQRYANSTHLDAIAPVLAQVVKNSPRLTVLIFCDGESQLNWTPYSNGVNQVFLKWKDSQKKQKQPFVIALRSQLGEYIGCTVNFPPGAVQLAQFPPMPTPPAPTNAVPLPPLTNKPPVRMGAPLIIVGTKVGTNVPPAKALVTNNAPPPTSVAPMAETNVAPSVPAKTVEPTNAVAPANTMPPAQSVAQFASAVVPKTNVEIKPPPPQPNLRSTNAVVATQTNAVQSAQTNQIAASLPIAPANPIASANAATPPENSGLNRTAAFAIGATALVIAIVATALLIIRARRGNRGSLISRSMRKP